MVEVAVEVREKLKEIGRRVTLVNVRFVKPYDQQEIDELVKQHTTLVTMEENVLSGGYGEKVTKYVVDSGYKVKVINCGIPNIYVEHGNVDILKKEVEIDAKSIFDRILENEQ